MPTTQVAGLYNSQVAVSSGEAVTVDFVYSATRVHDAILIKPALVAYIMWVFILQFAIIWFVFVGSVFASC